MANFKINVARTLNAFTSGTYKVQEALYEFIDNSVDAKASEVLISVEKGNKEPVERVIIADNGIGMTSSVLLESLVFGADHRPRGKFEVSEFGVGFKAAAFALAENLTIITKASCDDEKINTAFLDRQRIFTEEEFEGPDDAPSRDYEDLWKKYSISDTTGAIFILENLNQNEYGSCKSFIGNENAGIRNEKAMASRYYHLINTQALKISTKNGKGAPKVLESSDPLRRNCEGVTKLIDSSYYWAAHKVKFDACTTKLTNDLTGPNGFGLYVKVAGTVVYHDSDTLLGMYKENTSHSHRWALRTEISFKDTDEFNKIFDFTSHKHDLSPKVGNYGDWLRDSDIGKTYTSEATRREKEREQQKTLKAVENREQADLSFITALNEQRELYGPSQQLRDFGFGKIKAIKPGKFDDTCQISKFKDGIIFYNNANSQISALNAAKDPVLMHQARVLATASALASALSDSENFAVPLADYTTFMVNMTVLQA